MAAKNETNELKITRIYDVPVKAVWEAWTDPKKAAKWWGPRGFTITTHSKDLKVGGSWDYTMHGPDGTDYPNTTRYFEVEKHKRLVYDHGGHKDRPPMFRVTVNFSELNGQTKMEMTMTLPTVEAARETRKFIKQAGGNATWDRLAEYLTENETGEQKFVINRSFDVSPSKMFTMWTDAERFSSWLAPTGFTMKFIRADIRPGGSAFYSMTNSQGVNFYGRLDYFEITAPGRLVYVQQFCDANENMGRHPLAPIWPEKVLATVTFAAESAGEAEQTRVTVAFEAYGKATADEIAAFKAEKGGMTQGWAGSFTKLEELLNVASF